MSSTGGVGDRRRQRRRLPALREDVAGEAMLGFPGSGKGEAARAHTLDICMDDARVSAKQHRLATVFAKGVTVYPPPTLIRELAWEADLGDSLSLPGGVGRRKKGLWGV